MKSVFKEQDIEIYYSQNEIKNNNTQENYNDKICNADTNCQAAE